jgi:hypothetical protein
MRKPLIINTLRCSKEMAHGLLMKTRRWHVYQCLARRETISSATKVEFHGWTWLIGEAGQVQQ